MATEAPVRFCRLCSQFLPITTFPKGPVRYLCKTHWTAQIYECAKKRKRREVEEASSSCQVIISKKPKSKSLLLLSPQPPPRKQTLSKLRSISILVDSKEDAKKVFGQEKVIMGLRDVETLVGSNLALRLIPANPLLALSNSNFIICTKEQRRLVTALWKTKKDAQAYSQLLCLLELSS